MGTDRKNTNACRVRKEVALQRCAINYWNRWVRRTSWNYFTEMAFWQYAGFVAEQMPLRRSGCFPPPPPPRFFFFLLKTWTPENQTFHLCLLTLEILPRKLPTTFHGNSRQNIFCYFLFFTISCENNDRCHHWLTVSWMSQVTSLHRDCLHCANGLLVWGGKEKLFVELKLQPSQRQSAQMFPIKLTNSVSDVRSVKGYCKVWQGSSS